MSCSEVSNRVLNHPLSSGDVAQNAYVVSFPMELATASTAPNTRLSTASGRQPPSNRSS
jgi:hypothetical protein